MKNEGKGLLDIRMDKDNLPVVLFEPVNGTVWLYKWELPSLFGITTQAVSANLDSIIKGHIVDVKETCVYDLCVRGNRIRYDIQQLNLEVIAAMAFRIDSPRAKLLREWFISQCLKSHQPDFPFVDTSQNCSLN